MFKRFLKIFGIVLACAIVGVGILIGVLAIQGKFKKPNVPPESLYFDYEDDVLNVTYYATGADALTGVTKNNVYNFVLKATPDNVTQLNVTMSVIRGSQLIDFCNEFGEIIKNQSLESVIKIGQPVYFKISDKFDANDSTGYETRGEVYIEFTCKAMRNAELTIKIDRQTSDVSLLDVNNAQNNNQVNGKFVVEEDRYSFDSGKTYSEKPENFESYYIKNSEGKYELVSEEFDPTVIYYTRTIKDLEIEVSSSNTEFYPLTPVFAPAYSNEPIAGSPKACDIFIKNGDNYDRINETSLDVIVNQDGKYYFQPYMSNSYDLYVVTYPTYQAQADCEANFVYESNATYIFENPYSITKHIVLTVINSEVNEVYFGNEASILYVKTKLFEETNLVVKNSSISNGYNLDVAMKSKTTNITSRYDQIKFLDMKNDFSTNTIVLSSGNKAIKIFDKKIQILGFEEYDNTYEISVEEDEQNNGIKLKAFKETSKIIEISFIYNKSEVSKDGYYQLLFDEVKVYDNSGNIDSQLSAGWEINTKATDAVNDFMSPVENFIIVKKAKTNDGYDYSFGTINTGTYIVILQEDNKLVNNYFDVKETGFGTDKVFTITPQSLLFDLSMYILVVNQDLSYCYNENAGVLKIEYDEPIVTQTSSNSTLQAQYLIKDGNVKFANSGLNVSDLVSVNEGSFVYPLMFVKKDNTKVETIEQIYFEENEEIYVLAGSLDDQGKFINKLIPLENTIGSQDVYIVFLNYNYGVKSSEEIVNLRTNFLKGSTSNSENSESYEIVGDLKVGGTVKVDGTSYVVSEINTEYNLGISTTTVTYKSSDNEEVVGSFDFVTNKIETSEIITRVENPISVEISYVDSITQSGMTTTSTFGFEADLYKNETEKVTTTLNIKEDTDLELYFDISVTNDAYVQKEFLKLIAGVDSDGNVDFSGLNENFFIKLNSYSYSKSNDSESFGDSVIASCYIYANTSEDVATYPYIIRTQDTTKYMDIFKITSIEYFDGYIRVGFDVAEDNSDLFEGKAFKFEFSYGEKIATTKYIVIESTAVTGYYFKDISNELAIGKFDDYQIVYELGYNNGYTAFRDIYNKSGEIVSNSSISSSLITKDNGLIDDSLLTSQFIGANPTGYNEEEFDFVIESTSNNSVVDYSGNTLIIKGVGQSTITIKNKTKNSVKSSFDVVVRDTNLKLSIKSDNDEIIKNGDNDYTIEISANNSEVGGIFTYSYVNEEGANNLFDIASLINFEISDLSSGYSVKEETTTIGEDETIKTGNLSIVDNENNTVIELKYDTDNKWKLIRTTEYALATLSFKLTAKSNYGQSQAITIRYLSPVDIEKNAEHDYYNYTTIDYYLGTSLKIATSSEDNLITLYKLTDTSGNDGSLFKLRYKLNDTWYETGKSGLALTIDDSVVTELEVGETYTFQIYYNSYKFINFNVRILDNYIVNVSNSDRTENSETNPYDLTWGETTNINLNERIKVYSYDTTNSYTVYSTSVSSGELSPNVNYLSLVDISKFSVNKVSSDGDSSDNEMFEITGSTLSLNKLEITGSRVYEVELILLDSNENSYNCTIYVQVSSTYEFTSNLATNLSTINALTDYEISTTNFTLTKTDENSEERTISSINAINVYDENGKFVETLNSGNSFKGTYFKYENGKLAYIKAIGGNYKLQFVFELDNGWTLTDKDLYDVEVNNYFVNLQSDCYLIAGADNKKALTNLFETFDWSYIDYISISNINVDGAQEINSSNASNVYLWSNISGTINFEITYYYKEDSSEYQNAYTHTYSIALKSANRAEVEYVFTNLTVDTSNISFTKLDSSVTILGKMSYDTVITKEIIDLSERFKVYSNSDDELVENISLSSISLVAYSTNLENYKTLIVPNNISGKYYIEIGDFDVIGYAQYRLEATDGTTCYYLIKISPESSIGAELLETSENTTSRQTIRYTNNDNKYYWTYTEGTKIGDILTVSNLAYDFDIDITKLTASSTNIIYTLIDLDKLNNSYLDYGVNLKAYGNLQSKDIVNASNPYIMKVAVVVELGNGGQYYLGDYSITIKPDVAIATQDYSSTPIKEIKETDDSLYEYNVTINAETGNFNLSSLFNIAELNINISSKSVTNVKLGDTEFTLELSDIISIGDTGTVIISKLVAQTLTMDVELTLDNGLIVVLHITYLPYENTNTTTTYTLGWNGAKFVDAINYSDLIKDYSGNISVTIDSVDVKIEESTTFDVDGLYQFTLPNYEQQKVEMVITLIDVYGSPSYRFNIILKPNVEAVFVTGNAESTKVETEVSETISKLSVDFGYETETDGITVKYYYAKIYTSKNTIVTIYSTTKQNLSLSLVKLVENEWTTVDDNENYLTTTEISDAGDIEFIPMATSIDTVLQFTVNGNKFYVYLTVSQTYEANINYNILKTEGSEEKTQMSNSHIVTVDGSINLSSLTELSGDYKWTITSDTTKYSLSPYKIEFVDLKNATISDLSALLNGLNSLEFGIYYYYNGSLVIDSNEIYATISEDGKLTFNSSGTVYLKVTNKTGLEEWYTFDIEEKSGSQNEIKMNENLPTGYEVNDGTEVDYYSVTLNELKGGLKIATLNYAPTKDLFFGLIVDEKTITFDDTDLSGGRFEIEIESEKLMFKYEFRNNYDLYLIFDDKNSSYLIDSILSLNIKFVTMNGVNKEFNLKITDISVEYGLNQAGVTIAESIYANQTGVYLSGTTKTADGTTVQRIKITNNGTEVAYNSSQNTSEATYYIRYAGNNNDAYSDKIVANNRKLEEGFANISEFNSYFDDMFSIYGVEKDVSMTLYFDLYYFDLYYNKESSNLIWIKRINYSLIIKNDIIINVNNATDTGTYLSANIYLNDYKYDSTNGFKIDLINSTEEGNYRGTYVTYYNNRLSRDVFNGSKGNNAIENYLLIEQLSRNNTYADKVVSADTKTNSSGLVGWTGILYLTKDEACEIRFTIRAQYSDEYFITVVLNVHATVTIEQSSSENEIDNGTGEGYKSGATVNFIKVNDEDNSYDAMFHIYKEKTISSFNVETNIVETSSFEIKYAIISSLTEAENISSWNNISLEGSNNPYSITLPYVPYSTTQKYIVRFKLTTTGADGTERIFYCNYLVSNSVNIELNDKYSTKLLSTNSACISSNELTLISSDENVDALFKYSTDVESFINNCDYVKFKNVKNGTDVTFSINKDYSIRLTFRLTLDSVEKWFNNSTTFDLVFMNGSTELYTIAGFTITASDALTPKNSKYLTDLFLESELGDDLITKEFVAVVDSVITNANVSDYMNGTISMDNNILVKTIERTDENEITNTYKIYSMTLTKSGEGGDYYNLTDTFYYIVTSDKEFIQSTTGNFYISQVVNSGTEGLEFYIEDYFNIFDGSNFGKMDLNNTEITMDYNNTEITLIDIDVNSSVSVSGTTITISTPSTMEFKIGITYNSSVYREFTVKITVKGENIA